MVCFASMSLTAATPPPPPPQSWTVFGLELGKPLAIPECHHKVSSRGFVFSTYEDDPAETCYEPDIELQGAPPWRRGSVNFPLKKMPLILHLNSGYTLIVNGKLEGLQFDTLNYGNTDAIIRELSVKFGRPTSVTRFTANPANVPVPATHAEWRLPNLYVSYRNIDYSVDYGALLIETPIMQVARRVKERAQEAERTKL
jgi:hypothetical protein